MCEPTAIAIASLAIGVYGRVAGAKAQNKASEANKEAALKSQREASKDISLLQQQQVDATSRTIYEADRNARSTQALARVSAGEAGVTGVSVEALLGDIDRKFGEFKSTAGRNLDSVLDSLQREKISGRTVAQGRISAVQPSNPYATAIGIASEGLAFWSGQIGRNKPSSGGN